MARRSRFTDLRNSAFSIAFEVEAGNRKIAPRLGCCPNASLKVDAIETPKRTLTALSVKLNNSTVKAHAKKENKELLETIVR